MNYRQAYTALVAHGCSGGEARDLLEQAEIMPVKGWAGSTYLTVTFGKDGFTITEEKA
jgi:hypothetical protein